MKICDKCKKRSIYDINVECQDKKMSGLASWYMNMCKECMDELEKIIENFIGVEHDK